MRIAKLKRSGTYSMAFIREIASAKATRIALVCDSWFSKLGGLLPEWIRVARWTIRDNIICGDEVVSFYAVRREEAQELYKCLRQFSSRLPRDVIQYYGR
jgi:hypothetical protein